MDKRKAFGYNHWFLKNAIFRMLVDESQYFGIEDVKFNNGRKLSEEEISARYKLCNLISMHIEGVINRTDIMAVLYKTDFIIVEGRLDTSMHYNEIAFEEKMRMAEEEGYNV